MLKRVSVLVIPLLAATATLAQDVSWVPQRGPTGGTVIDIEVVPASETVLLIDGRGRAFVSFNSGTSWQGATLSGNSQQQFNDIEIIGNTIFLVGDYSLFASTDGGNFFEPRMNSDNEYSSGKRMKKMPISGALVTLSFNALYKSIDEGVSWASTAALSGMDPNYQLAVNAVDQIFILKKDQSNVLRPFRSSDGGASFIQHDDGIPGGQNVLSLTADRQGNAVYCVTSTDIFESTDGSSWVSIKNGIADATISDESHPGLLVFSADDAGMFFVDNVNHKLHSKGLNETTWTLRSGSFPSGSQTARAMASLNYPAVVTTATAYIGSAAGVYKTVTGGASVSLFNTGFPGVSGRKLIASGGYLFLGAVAPNDGYFNYDFVDLLRSQDQGNNWTKLSGFPSPFENFYGNESALFVQDPDDKIYRSTNNGTDWSLLSPPSGAMTYLNPVGYSKVFGFTNESNPPPLYYSKNNGTSWTASPLAITGMPGSYFLFGAVMASENNMLVSIYDQGTSSDAYYRIDLAYDGSDNVSSATASHITMPAIETDIVEGKAGKYYVFDRTGSQVAISENGGDSWTIIAAPAFDEAMVLDNGYIMLLENANPDKLYLSRDDGETFIDTSLPASLNIYDVRSAAVDFSGFAYLAVDGNYMFQSRKPIVIPVALSNLEVVAYTGTAVAIRWQDANLYSHDVIVERAVDDGPFQEIGESFAGTCVDWSYFVDDDLQPSTTYSYRVKARNDAGSSPPSGTVTLTTLAHCEPDLPQNTTWVANTSGTEGYPPLGSPAEVSIRHVGDGKYRISDVAFGLVGFGSEPATFYVSCSTTLLGSPGDVNPNGTGTWDSQTQTLTLKWRACNDGKTETITLTPSLTQKKPEKPDVLHAYVNSNTTVELKWLPAYNESTYVLERSLSQGSGFSEIATVDFPQTSFIDNGPFTEGVTYFYRMKARNGNAVPDESEYSDVARVPFQKPNFLIADNAITDFNSATLGSIWADFDNDGLQDYMTLHFDAENNETRPVIFKNLGTDFEKIDVNLGDERYFLPSVADIDNDGLPDLAVAGDGTLVFDIFKGNGDFTFTKIPPGQLGALGAITNEVSGSSWADIDNDGLLDVITIHPEDGSFTVYKQNTNHTFSLVFEGAPTEDESLLLAWADYDNDGFQDFIKSNVDGTGGLYRNNGDNTFTRVTGSGFDGEQFFTAAWADYNNDGHMDLFCGSFATNALYLNNGDGTFTKDVSTSISENTPSISATWGDFNNDGYLDLFTSGFLQYQSRLFIRDASAAPDVVFHKITSEKINDFTYSHYSVGAADFDEDGLLDLGLSTFIFNDELGDAIFGANNYFYRNNNTAKNWCQVKLLPQNGSEAIGARITLTVGSQTMTREIASVTSLASRNSIVAHFGLGSATVIDNLRVRWPNGTIQDIPNPPINQVLHIAEDMTPPQISFNAPSTQVKGFGSVNANITVTDNRVVSSVIVSIRKISESRFNDVAATKGTGDTWTVSISEATHFDATGTEFYITAIDGQGNIAREPEGDATHKVYLKYSAEQAVIPGSNLGVGGTKESWKVFSIPFPLSSPNNQITNIFDEFAGLSNRIDYRLITLANDNTWSEYDNSFTTISRGTGYFINFATNPGTIDLYNDLTAPDNSQSNLFKMNLKAGWNMIGNPYLTAISWDDVAAHNDLQGAEAQLKTYSNGTYSNDQSLQPYEGGFVLMESAKTVEIPFLGQGTSGGRQGVKPLGPYIDERDWLLPLILHQEDVVYELGGIGMASDARTDMDNYDDVTPPRFLDYLEINFDHPEHIAKRFTRDIVPANDDHVWEFTVESNLSGLAELTWNKEPLARATKSMLLLDVDRHRLVNMKGVRSYRFDPRGSSRFRIYYGDNVNPLPEQVSLGEAYPNPTRGLTTIAFSLPETGGLQQSVLLELTDAMGRGIQAIRQGRFDPGYHQAEFDATDLRSGFYTYRLTVSNRDGKRTEVNKLIIK